MMTRSRKVAQTFRPTLVGRLAILQQCEVAAGDSFASASEIAAFDPRDSGATIRRPPSGVEQSAASIRLYGFSHVFGAFRDSSALRAHGGVGEPLKGKSSISRRSNVFPSPLAGPYWMDHYIKSPNSLPSHEYTLVLAESLRRKGYFAQTRNLASDTRIPLEQTDGKKPLDSNLNKNKEDSKKNVNEVDDRNDGKSLGARVKHLLSDLENVPVPALGLGLAGAIPFVALTPGIASILPLPEWLYDVHIEAQAAYGAVILTFLGGPHWGLAMTDDGGSSKSVFSRVSIRTLRYVWSVVPSLVAWPAILLPLVPKYVVLITSFGLICGVDALFTRMGLLPSWYMPLRILLTSIAMLSMTSSLIVTAAVNAAAAVTQ